MFGQKEWERREESGLKFHCLVRRKDMRERKKEDKWFYGSQYFFFVDNLTVGGFEPERFRWKYQEVLTNCTIKLVVGPTTFFYFINFPQNP